MTFNLKEVVNFEDHIEDLLNLAELVDFVDHMDLLDLVGLC